MAAELERNPLWLILVDTVHALPLYPSHKAYVRDSMIVESQEISAEEASFRLDMPLGEAIVILHELANERSGAKTEGGEN